MLLALLSSQALAEQVTLQLKWKHQFQFAGYYAAIEQGYYQQAGLSVSIREAQPGQDPVQAVLNGEAEFGIGTSELAILRDQGAPVVVLGVVFQHSPLVLVARKDLGISNIHDLAGRRVMIEPNSAEIIAYLNQEGLDPSAFKQLEHSFNTEDLIAGRIDAMTAYLTDEPYMLEKAGIDISIFKPSSGGIDFYGDNLFTTQAMIDDHPSLIERFRQASWQGWQYAMQHPDEMVELIYQNYSQRHSKAHLHYEAQAMSNLLQSQLVAPGHMYSGRWQHIIKVFQQQGKIGATFALDPFLYDTQLNNQLERLQRTFLLVLVMLVFVVLAVSFVWRLNRKLSASQAWFATVLEHAPTAMVITDRYGLIKGWSKQAESTFGWSADEAVGTNLYDFILPEQERAEVKSRLSHLFESGEASAVENWNLTKDGRQILCQWRNAIPHTPRGEKVLVSMAIDVTEQRAMEQQLTKLAHTDTLTGLANRALFYERFNQLLKLAQRERKQIALLFIDLDDFKQINDQYGHSVGDRVLQALAQRLNLAVRQSDVVARIGGDEFVVLLYDSQGPQEVETLAAKLLEQLTLPLELGERQTVQISASIGISRYPENGAEMGQLLSIADQAMYRVKHGGKNDIAAATGSPPSPA